MIIKSLRLKNFRQFKDETKLDFATDKNKNVTLILGDNTFGKTTLLQAFNWCFYGKVLFAQNPKMLLNYDVSENMAPKQRTSVEVEITLVHNSREYTFKRIQWYTRRDIGSVGEELCPLTITYKENGEVKTVRGTNVKGVVNTIIPEDLSLYFFFDTERVNSISNRKDVGTAVKNLMGISVIDSALDHLGTKTKKDSVIGKFYSDLQQGSTADAKKYINNIHDFEAAKEAIAEKIANFKAEIANYNTKKSELEAKLRDNKRTAELQKKKEKLVRDIKTQENAYERNVDAFFNQFSEKSLKIFAAPLIGGVKKYLKDTKIDEKGVIDVTNKTIMALIRRGKCLCGTEFKQSEADPIYKHLLDEMHYVPPESIGSTVKHYREKLDYFSKGVDEAFESLGNTHKNALSALILAQEWEDDLETISKELQGQADMGQYEIELVKTNNRIKELNQKIEDLIRQDENYNRSIDGAKKKYDSLVVISGKNKEVREYIEYAEDIAMFLQSYRQEKATEIRHKLQLKVNEIFGKMYHGSRNVMIDERYNVSLSTTVNGRTIVTGESEGSNRVKNFAFIAGLVALAKEKVLSDQAKKGISIETEPYPLVMDAPFSNADERHTQNIAQLLPDIAEQVIMFVMDKDWKNAKEKMAHKVGRTYMLQKHSETHTTII